MSEVLQDTIVINQNVLEDPIVQDFLALDAQDLSNPMSDKGVVEKRVLVEHESKKTAIAPVLGGSSGVVIEIDNTPSVMFIPDDAELRMNYTTDNFFAYPRYGAGGLIQQLEVHTRGSHKVQIENIDDYRKVLQPLQDIYMSNSFVNQHLAPLENSQWITPVEVAAGNFTLAGTTLTVSANHGLTADDVGRVFGVRWDSGVSRFFRLASVTSATVVEINYDGGIPSGADIAISAGVLRYFPMLDGEGELGTIGVYCSNTQERAMGWDLLDRPAEMFHTLRGSGYLSGGQARYLALTGGLQITLRLAVHSAGLYSPFADATGAKYQLSGLWYQMEELHLSPSSWRDIDTQMANMAMDNTQYGPFIHFDSSHIQRETIAGNAGQATKKNEFATSFANVDSMILWRQPATVDSDMTVDSTVHVNTALKALSFNYKSKAWKPVERQSYGSKKSLFAALYKETEIGSSAQVDTMNFVEFSAKPYIPFNMQALRVSDNYTGIMTDSTNKFDTTMEYYPNAAPAVEHELYWLAHVKRRLVVKHDVKSGYYLEKVLD